MLFHGYKTPLNPWFVKIKAHGYIGGRPKLASPPKPVTVHRPRRSDIAIHWKRDIGIKVHLVL